MTEKKPKTVIRKLALPLEFTIANEGTASDGFFRLDKKDVSKIVIRSIDSDGYAICELFPAALEISSISAIVSSDYVELIGREFSKGTGRGSDVGEYKYFERSDGHIYAEISGKRKRRIHLGSLRDRASKISIAKQTIARHFQMGKQFDKKELSIFLPKHLTYGQILKSALDVLKIKGYLDKRETKYMGRSHEQFIPTERTFELKPVDMAKWVKTKASSEQS